MKINYVTRFGLLLVLGALTALGTSVSANAQGPDRQQRKEEQKPQRVKEQPTGPPTQGRQNKDQEQSRRQEEDQRKANERQAQEQQRSEQRRQSEQQRQSQDQQRQEWQRRQAADQQRVKQEQIRVEQQRQLEQQKRDSEDQRRKDQEQPRREAQGRRQQGDPKPIDRIPPRQEQGGGGGARQGDRGQGRDFRLPPGPVTNRDEWRRREQEMLHSRQNEFRRRDEERRRAWEQRERWLQQQRRMNQWRFHQQYWERLRRDQIRLQSFTYYDYGSPSYRYYRGGQYYELNQYGADLLRRAVNQGYEEGFRAGLADRQDGWRFDYESSDAFADATFGYDGYYVNLSEYQYYFREGFRRGYEDGYYGRYQYGSYSNGSYNILSDVLNLILNLSRY